MPRTAAFTFEEMAVVIKTALQTASVLSYVPDRNVVISKSFEKDTVQTFEDYLIRIFPADSGFIIKNPKIGKYYRNIYVVAIELWVKSGLAVADRLVSGNIRRKKGIYDFFQDVSDTLEHNTFSDQLDPYPGSNILTPTLLEATDQLVEKLGFLWMGNQDNIK